MYKFAHLQKNRRAAVIVGVTAAVILAGGMVLWAELPSGKPDSKVRVDSFAPSGSTGLTTNIIVRFSNKLVSEDELNIPTTRVPVKIEPAVPGLARWTEPHTLVIYPDDPLLPATEYVAEIVSGGGYVDSNAIKDNRQFRFYTPPVSVKVVRYQAQRPRIGPRQARLIIDLEFKYSVSRAQFEQFLSIRGDKDATQSSLSLTTLDSSESALRVPDLSREHRLVTEPFDLSADKQTYRLTINEGFKCPTCGDGLPSKFEYIMAVPSQPKTELTVTRANPRQSGTQGMIEITMSGKVPTDEVRDYVTIDPPVKFTVESHWYVIKLHGDFKPKATYTVNIEAGMSSEEGTLLERSFSSRLQMSDLNPSISFTSPGIYLPRESSRLLEIETVNIDTVSVEVQQVFANNLVTFLASGASRNSYSYGPAGVYSRKILAEDFPLGHERNTSLTSTLDIGKIISDTLRGVFAVSARNKVRRWNYDSRLVMLTDIGLTARMSHDYLMVWANSLSEAKPIKKAVVKLFSRNNQLLLQEKTNKEGVAIFADIADKIGDFQPYLITVEKDDDLGYLCFQGSSIPLSDFDVDGRPYLTKGYEAFLYTDRGVYRPGETAHLVSAVRQAGGAIPKAFPCLIKITDSRGRDFREYRVEAGTSLSELSIELPDYVSTGRYNVTAHIADEYAMGRTDFLVEEFVPDRIKTSVSTAKSDYAAGEDIVINVSGRMLYGPPAFGHKVSCELALQPRNFRPPGHAAYSFADPGRKTAPQRVKLADSTLSDSGTIVYHYKLERGVRPQAQLTGIIWATVSETGGRAVSASDEVTLNPYERYVGVKTDLDGYAAPGKPVSAHVVALHPDAQPVGLDSVIVRFSRVIYNSMLQRRPNGSYRFVSEESEEVIDSAWLAVDIDGADISFTPQNYGHYRITAGDIAGGHAAAVRFYASGWGRVPWSMAEPDRLNLDFDQANYGSGSVATLQVRAPFSGRLLVTIENDIVQEYFAVDLPENTAEIKIPVEDEYAPNVYVTATLIRPAAQITKHAPARAFGIAPLLVTPEEKRLVVEIDVPAETKPNTTLPVHISTGGSVTARITVAAVDVGITQLTSYETPDPFDFFYGKRRPALNPYDVYSQVYPHTERAQSHLSPPGDILKIREVSREINPFAARRVNVVSLWSGIVAADSTGAASVEFKIPEFNGQLAVMAVACDGDRFGSAEAAVLARDKIVIQESFPRFVAPNDIVDGLITVFNGMDTTATIAVSCKLSGCATALSDAAKEVTLAPNREGAVRFKFQSTPTPGVVGVNIHAASGAERASTTFEMSNRPARPVTVEYGAGVVTKDNPASFTLPGNWVEGTDSYVIRTSSMAALRVTKNIEYLLAYPYGCVEQTTSRLFPLLYFDNLAKVVRPELFGGKGHEYFIAEGIERLLRMQQSGGGFAFWPGGKTVRNWPSIYAAHFLVEAAKVGYDVEKGSYKRLMSFLTDMARGKKYEEIGTPQRVYACYVLAKAGKLDGKLTEFLTGLSHDDLPAYSRYQLAAALALVGYVDLAKEMVPFDIQPVNFEPENGGNLSSGVRTNAILLDLLLDVDPSNVSTFALAKSLMDEATVNRWYNTQATSFALAALGRFFAGAESAPFTGEIKIEGVATYKIDTSDFAVSREGLAGRTVNINIDGQAACYYYWQARGISTAPTADEYQRGIKITREYRDDTGNLLQPDSVPLGAQIVGCITVKATDKDISNVAISDLLPAGFEIENPRLETSARLPWRKGTLHTPDYQDVRDDRLLLFVDLPPGKQREFYYSLRAIAAGQYTIPPIAAECMYNPLIGGLSSAGVLTVVE